jgi:integrase
VRFFVRHFQRRHPRERGAAEVQAFLSMLANERHVSASTHNPALSALLSLYRAVLKQELPWLDQLERPRRPQRLPVVLSLQEVQAVLARMDGEHALLARLLYGTGMRIIEALRLRVKDMDFDRLTLVVRQGKGNKDRALMLPQTLVADLRAELAYSSSLWLRDRADKVAGVELPYALARKYPRAPQYGPSSVEAAVGFGGWWRRGFKEAAEETGSCRHGVIPHCPAVWPSAARLCAAARAASASGSR